MTWMCLFVGKVPRVSADATNQVVGGVCVLCVRKNVVARLNYVILSRWLVIKPLSVYVEEEIGKVWKIMMCTWNG